jgi:hypothetical protein
MLLAVCGTNRYPLGYLNLRELLEFLVATRMYTSSREKREEAMTDTAPEHRSVLKTCSICKIEQPVDDFYNCKSRSSGKQSRCKSCNIEETRRWRKNNPGSQREVDLRHKYKMDQKAYDRMLTAQNGVCAICGRINDNGKALSVDHDHSCCPGKRSCGNCIRQLLCGNCNNGLGRFKDDPMLLKKATEYLERHMNV